MNHVRKVMPRRRRSSTSVAYEPLNGGDEPTDFNPSAIEDEVQQQREQVPFSWLEYSIFAFLGTAMLWSW